MPLHKDYVNTVKGTGSDLLNLTGPHGGCSTAAAFLS